IVILLVFAAVTVFISGLWIGAIWPRGARPLGSLGPLDKFKQPIDHYLLADYYEKCAYLKMERARQQHIRFRPGWDTAAAENLNDAETYLIKAEQLRSVTQLTDPAPSLKIAPFSRHY